MFLSMEIDAKPEPEPRRDPMEGIWGTPSFTTNRTIYWLLNRGI